MLSESPDYWHFMRALGVPVGWRRHLFQYQAVLEGHGPCPTHTTSFILPLYSGVRGAQGEDTIYLV